MTGALVLAIAAAASGAIVLRGTEAPATAPIESVTEAGVLLGGAEARLIGWQDVKGATGEDEARIAPFSELADLAWRARLRLERGDTALARPLFERLFARTRAHPGPTLLLAAEGLMRCRLAEGDSTGAVEPMLSTIALREIGAADPAAGAMNVDRESGLVPALPPLFMGGRDLGEVVAIEPRAFESDPLVSALAAWYRRAAQGETGRVTGDDPRSGPEPGLALVSAMVRARIGPGEDVRAASRAVLRSVADANTGTWQEAWARMGIGRSLLLEKTDAARTQGILELLHLPARFAGELPALSAGALAEAAAALAQRGDASGSARLMRAFEENSPGVEAGEADGGPASALDRFLAGLGLDGLRARALEGELGSAKPDRKLELARTLGDVYARLLESSPDEARQAEVEARAGRLLQEVPEADSTELRLTLARAGYARAERLAERIRLRLAPASEGDAARRTFAQIIPALEAIASKASSRLDELERQEETVKSGGDELLSAALMASRRHRSLAHYLAGWAWCYVGELDPPSSRESGDRALRHFGWLLNARKDQHASLADVPKQMLQYEHVARAVVGTAMSYSVLGSADDALAWLDLASGERTLPGEVADELPARRLIILGRAGRWEDVRTMLDALAPRPGPGRDPARQGPDVELSAQNARLLLVLALDASEDSAATPVVQTLYKRGALRLISGGQQSMLADLAEPLLARLIAGTEGSASEALVQYLRGLRAFDGARAALRESGGREDEPAASPDLRVRFAGAASAFQKAGAGLMPVGDPALARAIASAAFLRAMSAFGACAGGTPLRDAADLFSQAARLSDGLDAEQAATARRMAIRAIDLAMEYPGAPAQLTPQRASLVEDFIDHHPSHPAAGALVYERAVSGTLPPAQALRDLLAIQSVSPVYEAARHQAARLLYAKYLGSAEADRAGTARGFLDVAEPLLESDRRRIAAGEAGAAERAVLNARRIVDCLLSLSPPEPERAQRALDVLRSLVTKGLIEQARVRAEILYRSVQIDLLRGDSVSAGSGAMVIEELDPAIGSAARRLLFKDAVDRFLQLADTDPSGWTGQQRDELVVRARRVVESGAGVLPALRAKSDSAKDPSTGAAELAVARAAACLWQRERDPAAKKLASDGFARMVQRYPGSAQVLEQAARHYDEAEEREPALECWRTLLGLESPGSDPWFEARCRVVEILLTVEPERAEEILRQHTLVYPEYGPGRYGQRLSDVDKRLKVILQRRKEGAP